MKTNPTSDLEQHRVPQSKQRLANMNLVFFLLFALNTALSVCGRDLQNPMSRLRLFVWGLMAVGFLILTIQGRLEQRIVTLLDRLEEKGVLSAEERAAIGIGAPTPVEMRRGRRITWIMLGVAAILVAVLVVVSVRSGTR